MDSAKLTMGIVVALLTVIGWSCAPLTPLVDTAHQGKEQVVESEPLVGALEQYKLEKKNAPKGSPYSRPMWRYCFLRTSRAFARMSGISGGRWLDC